MYIVHVDIGIYKLNFSFIWLYISNTCTTKKIGICTYNVFVLHVHVWIHRRESTWKRERQREAREI